MRKLNEFGILGDINTSLLSATRRSREVSCVKPWAPEDSLPLKHMSYESYVIKEANDRLRRAISMGYTCVEDRYACDVAFCDRVHQEGRTLRDCIHDDLMAYGNCQIHPEHVLN